MCCSTEWPTTSRIVEQLGAITRRLTGLLFPHMRKYGIVTVSDAYKILDSICPSSRSRNSSSPSIILVSAYLTRLAEGIIPDFDSDQADSFAKGTVEPPLVTFIEESHASAHLNAKYIEWICSDVSKRMVEHCCIQWRKDLRDKAMQTYRETMKSIIKLRQEFCPGIVQRNVASSVLFKGNVLATVRSVWSDELDKIGWFKDSGDGSSQPSYWRY
ncbi:hypothetical protein EDB82DRAFT_469662 [Fusarium venenatum]|uniref:uncharacterized protein n=1 Tax=Fusarium venenatum TaxID=56646 RepID=UPI001DC8460D|nr:hypothetical protein EDB82DRAFT_469662 [Fusarium venenatum]